MDVRVRFAPSPTGALHIGGVRTALYNYLFARKHKGSFVLRIEDTDQNRFVEGALDYILDSLEWLGIKPDEGIKEGGDYGPYLQSERKELYREFADKLVESGNAYYAFDTPQDLEEMRERLKKEKKDSQLYNFLTRESMKNSLSLNEGETKELIESGTEYVIRLKVPENEKVPFEDLIRGQVEFETSNIDDKVLIKSDGMPTYHLANVVDDHLMKISHVIRGEEWLSSTPIHVLLYTSFGWENEMPKFAHLPLILKPDGNGKLSKRDADKQGFPIFPLSWTDPKSGDLSKGFREKGFLPEALINFLAFLGWNPGTQKELYTIDELVNDFSVERIQKGGSRFDYDKALWFNQQYVRGLDEVELGSSLAAILTENNIPFESSKISEAVLLMKDRITFLSDLYTEATYLWHRPDTYDENVARKKWNEESSKAIQALTESWDGLEIFTPATLKESIDNTLTGLGIAPGKIMQALRLSITGTGGGPDLIGIVSFLGKEETVERMQLALNKIEVK